MGGRSCDDIPPGYLRSLWQNMFVLLPVLIFESLEMYKFILMSEYFASVLSSSLPNRGAKLKRAFVAAENYCTKDVGQVTTILRKMCIFVGAQKAKFSFRCIVPSIFVYISCHAGDCRCALASYCLSRRAVMP